MSARVASGTVDCAFERSGKSVIIAIATNAIDVKTAFQQGVSTTKQHFPSQGAAYHQNAILATANIFRALPAAILFTFMNPNPPVN
jgi:hypothetical protein